MRQEYPIGSEQLGPENEIVPQPGQLDWMLEDFGEDLPHFLTVGDADLVTILRGGLFPIPSIWNSGSQGRSHLIKRAAFLFCDNAPMLPEEIVDWALENI